MGAQPKPTATIIPLQVAPRSSARDVLEQVARENYVAVAQMRCPGRLSGMALRARVAAIRRLRASGYTLCEIADLFLIDHTTVLYHLKRGR